jgi:hypothetical protein
MTWDKTAVCILVALALPVIIGAVAMAIPY